MIETFQERWKGFHYFSSMKYPLKNIFEVDNMVVFCLAQNLTFWKIRKKNLATSLAHLRKVWWISEKTIWQHWSKQQVIDLDILTSNLFVSFLFVFCKN
jgi:hypothetical protein